MVSFFKNRLPELLSSLLILLFVYTAISKLINFQRFGAVLSQSPLVGHWATSLSFSLPAIELLAALLLFLPQTRTRGFILSFILMAAFTGYIAFMLLFTEKLPCACGGVLSSIGWAGHLLFNIVFTGIAWTGYKTGKNRGPQHLTPSFLKNG
jgi:putative oxidoreductase